MQTNGIYDKMAEALDSSYKKTPSFKGELINKDAIAALDKEEIENELFEDKKYIQNKLKSVVDGITDVMDTLGGTLEEGAKASDFEAYSRLASTAKDILSELRKLAIESKKEERATKQIQNSNVPGLPQTGTTLNINGADALAMILDYNKMQEVRFET